MHGLSLQLKLGLLIAAACLATAVLGAHVSGRIYERQAERAALGTLREARQSYAALERSEIEKLAATLDALLADGALRAAFQARDRERLLALATPLFETMRERDRITHWYFIAPEPERTVFLRAHRPGLHGDRVDRITLSRAIETKELGAGTELGHTAFALRVVRPWYDRDRLLGYVELAEDVGPFLQAMKARTGDDYGLVVRKKYLDEREWSGASLPRASGWNDRKDAVLVDATSSLDGALEELGDLERLPDDGLDLGEQEAADRALLRGAFPVVDAGNRRVGALLVVHDFTLQHGALAAGRVEAFSALLALGALLSVGLGMLLRGMVFRRLVALRRKLEAGAAADGHPPAAAALSDDELSRIEALAARHPR